MSEPCMCGALDCKRCHPGNFRRSIYIGDLEGDEVEALEDLWDQKQESDAEQRRDDAALDRAHGFC
jgi:hypothetical protein